MVYLSDHEADFVFKVAVIGDGGVGKTSLIRRFTTDSFEKEYVMTLGAQFAEYIHEIEGLKIKLFFWDIAGQDDFHFLRPTFYQGSQAAIIVFSLEESEHGMEGFVHVDEWHKDFKKYCADVPIILFGNKADLVNEKEVKEDKVQKLVKKLGINRYFKTSAKTGNGVFQAFNFLIEALYSKHKS